MKTLEYLGYFYVRYLGTWATQVASKQQIFVEIYTPVIFTVI